MNDYFCDDFINVLGALQMIKLVCESGHKSEIIEACGNATLETDLYFEIYWDCLQTCADFVANPRCRDEETDLWIFSDKQMTQYHRLCKEYEDLKGIHPKENPFHNNVVEKVDQYMGEINDYSYGWTHKKGIRHQYASALYVYFGPEFYQFVEMISSICKIFSFYHTELIKLEKEVEALKSTGFNSFLEVKAA